MYFLLALNIYNLLGQKVATLVSKRQTVGSYEVQWDATGFVSGVYIYKILSINKSISSESHKMVLLK